MIRFILLLRNQRKARSTILAITIATITITMAFLGLTNLRLISSGASGSGSLTRVSSGLVHQDSLQSSSGPDTNYWTFFGDAHYGGGYTYNENSSGLYVGSHSPSSGTWAGFYAESPNENVLLYHATLSLLYPSLETTDGGSFNTGLYVQTYNGQVNYVACAASVQAGSSTYDWELDIATGNTNGATNVATVWRKNYPSSDTGDLTKSCTIVTNGSNLLQLYMNGALVYSKINQGLNMPEPFNAYLEVESTSTNMLFGKYVNYYGTIGTALTVNNVPSGDVVKLVDRNGNTLASGVGSSGTVNLEIASYNMPLSAAVEVLSSGGSVMATTGQVGLWGGNVYQFSSSTTSTGTTSSSTSSSSTGGTSTLTVNSVNSLGNTITGYYTALYDSNGNVLHTGYTPSTYTLSNGANYEVEADSYGGCTFSHWEGGSISGSVADPTSISINSPTTIKAVYTGSSCGPQTTTSTSTSFTTTSSSSSSSTSSSSTTTTSTSKSTTSTSSSSSRSATSRLSINSVNSLGNSIKGYYTELYDSSGNALGTAYTPTNYTLTNGVDYEIQADSYGPCTFSHWQGAGLTGSSTDPAPISISSDTTLTAVYIGTSCGSQTTTITTTSSSSTSSTTSSTTASSSTTTSTSTTSTTPTRSTVNVESVDQNNNPIAGYYTVFYRSNGNVLSTGYTPATFDTTSGSSYSVKVDNYGSCTFSHWSSVTRIACFRDGRLQKFLWSKGKRR